jgi:hypothetical protein
LIGWRQTLTTLPSNHIHCLFDQTKNRVEDGLWSWIRNITSLLTWVGFVSVFVFVSGFAVVVFGCCGGFTY